MQRGRQDAQEGQDRDGHRCHKHRPAGVELARTLHAGLPAQALDRQDDDEDQEHEDDRERGRKAHLPLKEREDVDLDARHRGQLPGPPPVET